MKRHTRSFSPSPQKGEIKKIVQKEEETKKFIVNKSLSSGSYNATFLLENKQEVLRIGLLKADNEEQNLDVKRGLAIVHALNAAPLSPLLGPSLLKELGKYQLIDYSNWTNHVSDLLPPDGAEDGDEFALQHIEYLAGGEFTYDSQAKLGITEDEVRFSLFSLVWFIASAQQYLGLRHHDLKARNIMFRITPVARTYSFHLLSYKKDEPELFFEFFSRFVPVVIDYDLASVETTRSKEARNFPGTRYASSPDILLDYLCKENEIECTRVYNEEVADYWSIGYSMLEMLLPYADLYFPFKAHSNNFADNAFKYLRETFKLMGATKETKGLLDNLFHACCIKSIVLHESLGNQTFIGLSSDWYMFSDAPFWNGWSKRMAEDNVYQQVLQAYKQLPFGLRSVLSILMSENPGERNQFDTPMALLAHLYFNGREEKHRHIAYYNYRAERLKILEDTCNLRHVISKYHPWIESALCASCADVNKKESYWCKCCDRVFCGVDCQQKEH